jgi:hypothetical protein
MRPLAFLVLCAALIAAGCVNTQTVRRPASPENIAAINTAAGKLPPLAIEYKLGPAPVEPLPREARSLQAADAKKTTFVKLDGVQSSVDSVLVKRVYITDRPSGAVQGFALGGLIGVLGAVALTLAIAAGDSQFSHGQLLFAFVPRFGLGGAAVGTLIGAATGRRTVFAFEDER